MNDYKKKLIQLLEKDELSLMERKWLLKYIETPGGDEELQQIMQEKFAGHIMDEPEADDAFSKNILQLIHRKINISKEEKPNTLWIWTKRIAIAASLIGVLSFTAYLYFTKSVNNTAQNNLATSVFRNDVPAGSKKAVLTLANGSTIILNDAKNGTLSRQGNATILKFNGKLSYVNQKASNAQIVYNTLSTPRAGKYQVELPDGTLVWLNSESTIRFPTNFIGLDRRVEISGEAYFEVAKNKSMPFIVKVNNSEVKVFGTHFNIMAYKDESVLKTTLLEGSVQFINGASTFMLKPGEQSVLAENGKLTKIEDVDVSDVIAWKNDLFHFENADIETVMRQLSRWYDVEIIYNKKVNDTFYAEIPTTSKLSEVLKVLEFTGKVHFEIKDKKIIVSP